MDGKELAALRTKHGATIIEMCGFLGISAGRWMHLIRRSKVPAQIEICTKFLSDFPGDEALVAFFDRMSNEFGLLNSELSDLLGLTTTKIAKGGRSGLTTRRLALILDVAIKNEGDLRGWQNAVKEIKAKRKAGQGASGADLMAQKTVQGATMVEMCDFYGVPANRWGNLVQRKSIPLQIEMLLTFLRVLPKCPDDAFVCAFIKRMQKEFGANQSDVSKMLGLHPSAANRIITKHKTCLTTRRLASMLDQVIHDVGDLDYWIEVGETARLNFQGKE